MKGRRWSWWWGLGAVLVGAGCSTIEKPSPEQPLERVASRSLLNDLIPEGDWCLHPTGRDITVRLKGDIRFCRGKQTDQAARSAMVEKCLAEMPRMIRYARSNAYCAGKIGTMLGSVRSIQTRFNVAIPYDDILGPPRKTWSIPADGSAAQLYDLCNTAAAQMAACSVANSYAAAQCAASKEMIPDFQDQLDLRIEGGKCVKGASFQLPVNPTYYSVYQFTGIADGRLFPGGQNKLRPRTAAEVDAIHKTHVAHLAVSNWRCDKTKPLPPNVTLVTDGVSVSYPAVEGAHRVYERMVTRAAFPDPVERARERNFRVMKSFPGFADTVRNGNPKGLTEAEECLGGRAEDNRHECWMQSQLAPDWGMSRSQCEGPHQSFHLALASAEIFRTVEMILPCGVLPIGKCPPMTVQQYVAP